MYEEGKASSARKERMDHTSIPDTSSGRSNMKQKSEPAVVARKANEWKGRRDDKLTAEARENVETPRCALF